MTTSIEERTFWESVDPTDLAGNVSGDPDPLYGLTTIDAALKIEPGWTVLDLGCGPGRLTLPLARKYAQSQFVGLDIAAPMLMEAERRAPSNATFARGDGREIPFDGLAHFDACFSMQLFQHLPPEAVRAYIAALARVLRAGGRFVVQWVYGESHRGFEHKYAVDEIVGWLEVAGFTVESVEPDATYNEWLWCVAVAS